MNFQNEIPIDSKLLDFRTYLMFYDRIIFSAKFGEGKSYFLNKFFEQFDRDFIAIKLFPINYQVEGNKDIFEMIKRDILVQLLANDSIADDNLLLNNIDCAESYFINNVFEIFTDIVKEIPKLGIPIKILNAAKKHFANFLIERKELQKTNKDISERFIDKIDSSCCAYEFDEISELIFRCVKLIQERSGRKVVLMIEDLDRIDPGQIFRILNVLSVHMNEQFEGITKTSNKFGFDKIIMVCHYENIEKIFHHLYGQDTDFNGYIQKFTTTKPFCYSIKNLVKDFIISHITDKEICFHKECLDILIEMIVFSINVNQQTIRFICDKLSMPLNESNLSGVTIGDKSIEPFSALSKFVILAKRFEINIDELLKVIFRKLDFIFLSKLIGENWFYATQGKMYLQLSNSNSIKLLLENNIVYLPEYDESINDFIWKHILTIEEEICKYLFDKEDYKEIEFLPKERRYVSIPNK